MKSDRAVMRDAVLIQQSLNGTESFATFQLSLVACEVLPRQDSRRGLFGFVSEFRSAVVSGFTYRG